MMNPIFITPLHLGHEIVVLFILGELFSESDSGGGEFVLSSAKRSAGLCFGRVQKLANGTFPKAEFWSSVWAWQSKISARW
jgi:hypothetical protein